MMAALPQFVLYARTNSFTDPTVGSLLARQGWRFVLKARDGSLNMDVSDVEPDVIGERLELLSVVRGLEALEQPSRVRLYTDSRYVVRGMRFGLEQWRVADWRWELYGEMAEVRDADLWRRVDHALEIHDVQYRWVRLDTVVAPAETVEVDASSGRVPAPHWLRRSRRFGGNCQSSAVRNAELEPEMMEFGVRPQLRLCCPD